jgi:YVTN family beta-propeller protein
MRLRVGIFGVLVLGSMIGMGAFMRLSKPVEPPGTQLPTGKFIKPIGESVDVGSYPANMAVSPDGKYVVVTNTGFRQQLSVLDALTGALKDKVEFNLGPKGEQLSLYYGLAFDSNGQLYASNGPLDQISVFNLSADGKLIAAGTIDDASGKNDEPNFVAGLAFGGQGHTLFAAHNEAYKSTHLASSLSVIDASSNSVTKEIEIPGFPLALAAITAGATKDKVYAGCERDGVVASVNPDTGVVVSIRTGMQPVGLLLNKKQDRLFVSNAGSDTISIIDTATDKVTKTIMTRPAALRGLPGTTPLGMALSPDEQTLFVALGDMNAVGVIDLRKNSLVGYIPVGWYPTSVAVVGNNLFVANAKGYKGANPNGKPLKGDAAYIQNIIEGTVSKIDLSQVKTQLPDLTQQVLVNNFAEKGGAQARSKDFKNPGIKHIIYILKENRTYDQVLGDNPRGNGDATNVLFGKDVTPNQHALADRFVLLDNFDVCAEVSADGWQWSMGGFASEYASRNVPFNYSGRGRDYDFEGQTNGVAVDYAGVNDVAGVPGGYIWDACLRQHVTFRNFGFYVDPIDKDEAKAGGIEIADNGPTKKALVKYTDDSFRQFDMHYADSELGNLYSSNEPKQLKTYGAHSATSRYSEWKREFDGMVAKGQMPQLQMVRFCRDHTAGTSIGLGSPQAMVADNDYAVGKLIEDISNSPFWKDTAIFVFEDDAQAGQDHVDCHRSTAYVISPFVHPGLVDSRFYNTDSALRTMELLLGLQPMNQYDATANPFMIFDSTPTNAAPYRATMPAREIATAINTPKAYRANDSTKLISWYKEDSMADLELNDILWHSIKGSVKPRNVAPIPAHSRDADGDGG